MKKTTKILSIILAIIMCMGIMPMSAFAENAIQKVEITVDCIPKTGKWGDCVCSYKANYSYDLWNFMGDERCCWVETDEKFTSFSDIAKGIKKYSADGIFTFKGDKYYTFVTLVKARSGYEFRSNSQVTINGFTANYTDYDGTDQYRYAWYCFDKTELATLKEIDLVSPPTKTQCQYKSEVSTDGLKVVAKYNDGTEVDVTNKVEIKGFSANQKEGLYTANVEFEGMTDYFSYTVEYAWWQMLIRIFLFGFIWY